MLLSLVMVSTAVVALAGARGPQRQSTAALSVGTRACVRVSRELRASAGQSTREQIADGLDLHLQARPGGWLLRVLPHSGPEPPVDFAGIATPPYRSVSPLLLSTDFGFRSQDVVGWNPREFHVIQDRKSYAEVFPAYQAVTRSAKASPGEEARLIQLLSSSAPAQLVIVDAAMVPGTADRSRAAASVPDRLNSTAHTYVAPPQGGKADALGQIVRLSVRVSLDLPPGAVRQHLSGVARSSVSCPAGAP